MEIFNQTRKTRLADNALIADSFLKRMRGLLGKRTFTYGQALVLKPCNSLHTYFMRFAIDVIFVNKNNSVVKIVNNLKPFRLSPVCLGSKFVIELPSGMIKLTSTCLADQLILK